MEILRLNTRVRVLHSAVNMGLVETEHGLVAIDTGLDKQSGKQLLKAANEWGKPIIAVLNTHAHADHFGGNPVILAGSTAGSELPELSVYAPVFEADVIRRPQYEPEYLWHGAAPVSSLRNKFLEAKPSIVTHVFAPGESLVIDGVSFETVSLAGHSINQAGVIVHDVFFAADAYFATEVTEKHGIPYMVNYQQTLESARTVLNQKADYFVPGHGQPLDKPPVSDVTFLTECHEALFAELVLLIRTDPMPIEQLIRSLCAYKAISLNSLGSYVLVRAPISAYITAAVEAGLADIRVDDGQVILCATDTQK